MVGTTAPRSTPDEISPFGGCGSADSRGRVQSNVVRVHSGGVAIEFDGVIFHWFYLVG